MKRLLTLFVVMGLVVAVSGVAKANLLSNGNVDLPGGGLPITNWTKDESKTFSGPTTDLASLEPWAGPAPTPVTPSDHAVFFKAFQGNNTTGDLATAHIYQDVPGTAGQKYVLTGWAGSEANYSGNVIGSPTKSQLAVEFLGAGNAVLGGTVLDMVLGVGNGGSNPPFGYKQFSVSGVAPAGTLNVRSRISMVDGYSNPAGGGQAYVADDFVLTAVPEPATFSLIGLAVAGLVGIRRRSN
jgi:hypothetical protein